MKPPQPSPAPDLPYSGSATHEPTCERCGRYGAVRLGDSWLCPDCVDIAGSCCPEFGSWDAWQSCPTRPVSTDKSPNAHETD